MAYSEQRDWEATELRRRGIGLGIALLLEALLIIAILSLSMRSGGPEAGKKGLSTFSLAPVWATAASKTWQMEVPCVPR